MSPAPSEFRQPDHGLTNRPLPLLLAVGSLLAISVLLSKVATTLNAPMLTYRALDVGGSGLIMIVMNGGIRRGNGGFSAFAVYGFVAGALMAQGSALGYLTVDRVGSAFIALALAFMPMLTWLLSPALRMERFDAFRVRGLLIGPGCNGPAGLNAAVA